MKAWNQLKHYFYRVHDFNNNSPRVLFRRVWPWHTWSFCGVYPGCHSGRCLRTWCTVPIHRFSIPPHLCGLIIHGKVTACYIMTRQRAGIELWEIGRYRYRGRYLPVFHRKFWVISFDGGGRPHRYKPTWKTNRVISNPVLGKNIVLYLGRRRLLGQWLSSKDGVCGVHLKTNPKGKHTVFFFR